MMLIFIRADELFISCNIIMIVSTVSIRNIEICYRSSRSVLFESADPAEEFIAFTCWRIRNFYRFIDT